MQKHIAELKKKNPPTPVDMSRTIAALAKYDALYAELDEVSSETPAAVLEGMLADIDKAEKAAGYALGLDTADRNRMEDCICTSVATVRHIVSILE